MSRTEHELQAFEQAALDAVGVLGPAGDRWLYDHLDRGCAVCREAVARVTVLFEQLHLAAPPVKPSARVRQRVLDRIRAKRLAGAPSSQPLNSKTPNSKPLNDGVDAAESQSSEPSTGQIWNQWVAGGDPAAVKTLAADSSDWEPTPFDGISVRRLHVDPSQDTVTMLIKMAPGTSYPAHRHGGAEHCYVIEGDICVEDRGEILRAGDYQVAPAGSTHGVQSTKAGCVLFIISSRRDEILAG